MRRKLLWVLGLAAFALLLSSCGLSHPTQSTLDPAGSTAQEEKDLFVPVFWVAVGVFVIVEGGIVLIMIRYRHRKGRDVMPPQVHGNTRLEVGWTILPAIVLVFVMVPTISVLWDLARTADADALHVTVEGHQWWWGYVYTDGDMKVSYGDRGPITVADVMVIPVHRQVDLSLESVGSLVGGSNPDFAVIHSFWIPRLAGKQDVVPGRTNHILFDADEPGTYTGQCAEFCGLQHGKMKFRVVALDGAGWRAWVANQRLAGVSPTDPTAARGMNLFLNELSGGRGSCVTCHTVGGTTAGGTGGPNLTHFADEAHECFAGCDWDTTDEAALRAWLTDPNAVKLGAKMPNYHLTPDEIDALVAYLYSLK